MFIPPPTSLRLFGKSFDQSLRGLTPPDILDMHREVQGELEAGLASIGGPQLKPIQAEALHTADFIAAHERNTGCPSNGVDWAQYGAFSRPIMQGGTLNWLMIYHIETLARRAEKPGAVVKTMVHEIGAGIYGPFLERLFLSDSNFDNSAPCGAHLLNRDEKELTAACEGWADYLSQSPFNTSELEVVETSLLRHPSPDAREVASSQHYFVALALSRIDAAFGQERLVELMHTPPGILEGSAPLRLKRVFKGFWKLYRDASRKKGRSYLPWEAIPSPTFAHLSNQRLNVAVR